MTIMEKMGAVHVSPKGKRQGPPLLLLHGVGNGSWVWERDQQRMSESGFESWALDMPGHGADVGSNPSLQDLCNAVSEAVDEMDSPPCVIGHSLGGLVAQMVAVEKDLHSLVLICSAPPGNIRVLPERQLLAPALIRLVPTLLGRPLDFTGKAYREIGFNCVPEEEHDALEALLTPWPNRLAKELILRAPKLQPAQCPVLVTCGLQDRLVSSRVARLIGDFHHNAITWRFDDVAHFPQLEPGGIRLMDAVLGWVKSPQRRRVLEIDAFSPTEGVGRKERKERNPNPERSDSRWKGRFRGRG
jgi:pimeloyl-ACP methyl ester carboxylesterase